MPVSMEKMPKGLIDLRKKVNVSLEKAGIANKTAKVKLCIDRSGSMARMYQDGFVQLTSEKILALASAFDDDGDIDMIGFDDRGYELPSLDLTNYEGGIDRIFAGRNYGGTNYATAFTVVRDQIREEKARGNKFPSYVAFITDGATSNETAAEVQLRDSKDENVFWQLVGIGHDDFSFLQKMAKKYPHVGYLSIGIQYTSVTEQIEKKRLFGRRSGTTHVTTRAVLDIADDQLYDKLINSGYAQWLK